MNYLARQETPSHVLLLLGSALVTIACLLASAQTIVPAATVSGNPQ